MSEFNKQVGAPTDAAHSAHLRKNWKDTDRSKIQTESTFIGADQIQALLSKPNAVGLRIFYGVSDEGHMQPVFYAADSEGRAIRSSDGKDASNDGGSNASLPCPPVCPKP